MKQAPAERKTIRIWFTDFWSDINNQDNYFVRVLAEKYDLVFDKENPEILFFSWYGKDYLNYKCIRVFYTADNVRVDFTACDFGIGFDYLDRLNYFRLPLYIYYLYGNLESLVKKNVDSQAILAKKTGFCAMIVSNPNSKRRIDFFQKLSKYKKVDSGGRYLNNIGGPVADKMKFIADYKFTFAFENSSFPGYTTEKIMEPMIAYSIPIYQGNPLISREFNPASFVNANDYKNDEELIERIVDLDKNDLKYQACLEQPYLYNNDINTLDFSREKFSAFLDRIVCSMVR